MRSSKVQFMYSWSSCLVGLFVCFLLHAVVGESSSNLELLSKKWSSLLYEKYFYNNATTKRLEGLEHLMGSIGLLDLDHGEHDHEDDHDHSEHDHPEKNVSVNLDFDMNTNSCLSAEQIMPLFKPAFDRDQFARLCPILLYQLDSKVCAEAALNSNKSGWQDNALEVWGYSFTAVVIISIAGLVVVAIIPLMHKSFYNVFSQFLIALAVGSLAGDALLHLIPHALVPHEKTTESESNHEHGSTHSSAVWKALVALLGIHLFFFTERLTILCQNSKSKRKLKMKKKMEDFEPTEARNSHHWEGGEKGGHWSDEEEHHHNHKTSKPSSIGQPCNQPVILQDNATCPDAMDMELCSTTVPLALNGSGPRCDDNKHSLDDTCQHKALLPPTSCQQIGGSPGAGILVVQANAHGDGSVGGGGAIVSDSMAHPHRDKPHGHHHGHSHDLSSVRAIAYTIIAGDGLHNFCDGIAIGAAFANDLRGGLSTSIAVLCHELPHELGDFAVLLHAGMSVKTAVFYNLLSSILCGLGMILGVLLGRIEEASSWIFMLTAGMFLYIALVDMMPELSTNRLKGSIFWHRPGMLFLWQNLGIILGSGIMLLIALFEDHIL